MKKPVLAPPCVFGFIKKKEKVQIFDVCSLCRPRQTQTKSKKEGLFGFDDNDFDLEEDSSDGTDGKSRYKIQYFGFDDMSDSDGEDDDTGSKPWRKVAEAAVAEATPEVAEEEEASDDFPDPFERLEQRESQQIWEKPAAKESKKSSERLDRKTHRGKRAFRGRRVVPFTALIGWDVESGAD